MNKPLLVDDYNLPIKKEYIVVTKLNVNQEKFVELLKSHDIDINIDYDGLKRHYNVSFVEEKYDSLLAEDDILVIEDANRLNEYDQQKGINHAGSGSIRNLQRLANHSFPALHLRNRTMTDGKGQVQP